MVIGLPLLIIGPLRHSPPLWNAAHVDESLAGRVVREGTAEQQIVSFVGRSRSPQKLLVRADLLVAPQTLEQTSLQLEYLPSGDICRGSVTSVENFSFSGSCRLPDGEHRTIEASWDPNSSGNSVVGRISVRD